MYIVALNGSYRGTRGVTHTLLKTIQAGMAEVGSSLDIITLARQKINAAWAAASARRRTITCNVCRSPTTTWPESSRSWRRPT